MQASALAYRWFGFLILTSALILSTPGESQAALNRDGSGRFTWTEPLEREVPPGGGPPSPSPIIRPTHIPDIIQAIDLSVLPVCNTNATVWSAQAREALSQVGHPGTPIRSTQINVLRQTIGELYRQYNVLPLPSFGVDVSPGNPILKSHIQSLRDALDAFSVSCPGGAVTTTCGNGGAPEVGEQCDDGNTINTDGCSSTCQWNGLVCGDRIRNISPGSTERCDDGNVISWDGCSSTCADESSMVFGPCTLSYPILVSRGPFDNFGQSNTSYFLDFASSTINLSGSGNSAHIERRDNAVTVGGSNNCVHASARQRINIAGSGFHNVDAVAGSLSGGFANVSSNNNILRITGFPTAITTVTGQNNTLLARGFQSIIDLVGGNNNLTIEGIGIKTINVRGSQNTTNLLGPVDNLNVISNNNILSVFRVSVGMLVTGNNNQVSFLQVLGDNNITVEGVNNNFTIPSDYNNITVRRNVVCSGACPSNTVNVAGFGFSNNYTIEGSNQRLTITGTNGTQQWIHFRNSTNSHVTIDDTPPYNMTNTGSSNNFVNGVRVN